jgi:hypothetical protein
MKRIIALALLLGTMEANAQESKIHFSVDGGVKRNVFRNVKKEIAAYNITGSYNESLVTPVVKNTYSFFSAMTAAKPVGKRFEVTSTLGLDMQQLNVESGFKRRVTTAGFTGYARENTSELLPRVKVAFGIDYRLASSDKHQLSIQLDAGEMIRLTSDGYSYSFAGAGINYKSRNIKLFVAGTLTPYNISLPNMDNYIGNMGADVIGSFQYRIYEMSAGVGFAL